MRLYFLFFVLTALYSASLIGASQDTYQREDKCRWLWAVRVQVMGVILPQLKNPSEWDMANKLLDNGALKQAEIEKQWSFKGHLVPELQRSIAREDREKGEALQAQKKWDTIIFGTGAAIIGFGLTRWMFKD